jgi:hypothetical protein
MNAVAAIQHRHISSAFCSIIVLLLRIAFFDRLETMDGANRGGGLNDTFSRMKALRR